MKYFLLLILGVLGCSMSPVFVRFSTAPSMVLVIYRMGLTAVLLAPAAWRCRKEFLALPKRSALLCAASGVMLGLHFSTYFEGVKNTSIAASSVLCNMSALFVALLSVLLLRKKLSAGAWLSILLAFAGAVVVALADGGGSQETALWGNLMALLSAVFIAGYTLIGAVCRKSVSTTVYTYFVYCMAFVTVLVLTTVSGTPVLGYGWENYAAALGMAVFCTLMGHSMFSLVLKYLPAPLVSTVQLLDCVCAFGWGVVLFSEYPGWVAIAGGVMVVAGVILYSRLAAKEEE